jgi:Tfp pilus assembly protein PilO
MSTAIAPPPATDKNNSMLRRVPQLTERAKELVTELNLHFAGVAVLLILVLYLLAHTIYVWQAMNAHDQAAIDQAHAQMVAAEIAAKPLRGLDRKLEASTTDADRFYKGRLPYAYSEVLAELGSVTKREGVRLTRVQYVQNGVLQGDDALTELRMDASVSGDYRSIVHFINAIERDKVFFVIYGINLTGQQTGQVNLRLRLTTYLRGSVPDELTPEVQPADAAGAASAKAGGRP